MFFQQHKEICRNTRTSFTGLDSYKPGEETACCDSGWAFLSSSFYLLRRLSRRQTNCAPPLLPHSSPLPDMECDAKCCKCQGTCEDVTSSSVRWQSGFESRAEYGSQRPGTPLMNNADPLQSAPSAQKPPLSLAKWGTQLLWLEGDGLRM